MRWMEQSRAQHKRDLWVRDDLLLRVRRGVALVANACCCGVALIFKVLRFRVFYRCVLECSSESESSRVRIGSHCEKKHTRLTATRSMRRRVPRRCGVHLQWMWGVMGANKRAQESVHCSSPCMHDRFPDLNRFTYCHEYTDSVSVTSAKHAPPFDQQLIC